MPDITQTVDTIAILMLENRSFDHMLGYLSLPYYAQGRAAVAGLRTASSDMSDYTGPLAELTGWFPNDDAGANVYSPFHFADGPLPADLPHGRSLVAIQMAQNTAGLFLMNGFVRSYHAYSQVRNVHPEPMGFFTPKEVPMMEFFAREYVVCDHWHCPLPTDTQPNRLMSLTGYTDREDTPLRPFPDELPTVLEWLTAKGVPWRVYSEDVSFFAFFNKFRGQIMLGPEDDEFRSTQRLRTDLQDMTQPFPKVIFIEPSFDDAPLIHEKPNCDHPPLPIGYGQEFLSRMYADLTSNPLRWGKTVLVVTYDEHGGFHDHVPPLPVGASYPEDVLQQVPTYDPFLTTGPRVPGLVVSPLVQRGSVYSRNLDHTCILQFLADRFDNQQPYSQVVEARARQGNFGRIADMLSLNTNDRRVVPGPALQRPVFATPVPHRRKRVGLYEMWRQPPPASVRAAAPVAALTTSGESGPKPRRRKRK
jgi:phospholipase C